MLHVMIMAGGKGTRFWPMSRAKKAKQFLTVIGEKSLIEYTLDRIEPLTEMSQRWILGSATQTDSLAPLSQRVPQRHILREPIGKNTAACIGWAAFEALKQDPEAICVVLPADAWITPDNAFHETIKMGVEEVRVNNSVVTIGIPPTQPHTGYGYIEVHDRSQPIMPVVSFTEKPGHDKAQAYLQSGRYFWNAGIFIWKASKIISCLQRYLPEHYEQLKAFTDAGHYEPEAIKPFYQTLDPISIDYGVMEHIGDDIRLIPASFQWSDIGNWSSLESFLPKDASDNASSGNLLAYKSHGNIVVSDKRLVALGCVDNLIVVDTQDAILILPKESDQDIKHIYEQLDDVYK